MNRAKYAFFYDKMCADEEPSGQGQRFLIFWGTFHILARTIATLVPPSSHLA